MYYGLSARVMQARARDGIGANFRWFWDIWTMRPVKTATRHPYTA